MEWTTEQKAAIDFRENKNLLLAAAAGSGKTAVLVERILRLITDEKNPVMITSLLVLTFTEAAASEMKRKIKRAIRSELEKNPNSELLQKQNLLVSSASVSTIDSFCKKKLSEYIHLTDIPSDFGVISETEADILLGQAIDEVLEKYYGRLEVLPSFKELCISLGSTGNNSEMKEMLTKLYKFSESMPYPAQWLNDCVKNYKYIFENGENPEAWKKPYEDELKGLAEDLRECISAVCEVLSELPHDHKYYLFYSTECEVLSGLLSEFEKDGYKDTSGFFRSFSFPAKVKVQKTYPTEEKKADAIRNIEKKLVEKIKSILNYYSSDYMELAPKIYRRARTLKNIILCVGRRYKRLKREKNGLSFSDLEHEFLNLISDKRHMPTQVACELKEKYSEILLDEYQDTNNIQEEIFRLISRDEKNIFMVGDLKQSIYKFRNAVPKLFADKYKLYAREPEKGGLIRLFKNFRSRTEVVEGINYIFSNIMSESLGDILYNEEEYLIQGAEYPQSDGCETEYYILRANEAAETEKTDSPTLAEEDRLGETEEDSLKETEAKFIGTRITELMQSGFEVYDSSRCEKRPIEYRDIVVLLRNRSSAPLIERVLEEKSIPVYTDTSKSYLSSREVSIVLSFLSIIDNPYQDIPLIAVLKSPIFSFSNEQLAAIRLAKENTYFYDAVVNAARDGVDEAEYFCGELDYFRSLAETSGVYKLILTIYERYNYMSLTGLMSFPELRRANLRLLLLRAAEFEKTKLTGLFGFMNYISGIKAAKKDLPPARVMSESENVVRIMTIHKSKGLEFPVVFLSDTAHEFNSTDIRKRVMWHETAGISIPFTDTENRINYPSVSDFVMKGIKAREMRSEEMRLLYVALTRAREKLIITSVMSQKLKNVKMPVLSSEKKPLAVQLKNANSYSEWLFPVLASHKRAENIRAYFGFDSDLVNLKSDFGFVSEVIEAGGRETLQSTAENQLAEEDVSFKPEYGGILSFVPERNEKIPIKVTVSEVKRRLTEENTYTAWLNAGRNIRLRENIYLKDKNDFTAAEKGTVTHFILQYIDEKQINSEEDIDNVLNKAERDGVISKAQREITDISSIAAFLSSPLGRRLKNSVYSKKEFSFYSERRAAEVYSGLSEKAGESRVLIQGTIDCFFEEADGTVVLLDYKTDNVKKEEAEKRAGEYKIQLECYKEALERILKKNVDESFVYFLKCGEAVKIQ